MCFLWRLPAATGAWMVFMGGLTEQRSMLGIKSRPDYLSDVLVLDRSADKVAWRGVEAGGAGPQPAGREKHTLTALSNGRMLLFGGARVCVRVVLLCACRHIMHIIILLLLLF